ncbi:MAG TPA: hypothetical protein ENJ18_10455, partial [Nannocystis exedens]|nr:hypothetical protein [Nannocystis exedens]
MTMIRLLVAFGLLASAAGCDRSATEAERSGEGHGEGHGEEHGDEAHGGEVHLDAHVIERNGIVTEKAQKRLLLGALEVPAEVKVNPD